MEKPNNTRQSIGNASETIWTSRTWCPFPALQTPNPTRPLCSHGSFLNHANIGIRSMPKCARTRAWPDWRRRAHCRSTANAWPTADSQPLSKPEHSLGVPTPCGCGSAAPWPPCETSSFLDVDSRCFASVSCIPSPASYRLLPRSTRPTARCPFKVRAASATSPAWKRKPKTNTT
jgi:hypothetical protein